MSKFVLHPEAYADLNEIWEYIAADNLDAADRVLKEIFNMLMSLTRFPQQGHVRPDLTSRPLRFQVVRDYVIAYAPDERPLAGDRDSARPPQSSRARSNSQPKRLRPQGSPPFESRKGWGNLISG